MKIKASIKYRIKKNHPDFKYIENWDAKKKYEFEDTYNVDPDMFWGEDHIASYIKNDLALVAGGGYDTDGIDIVKYELKKEN